MLTAIRNWVVQTMMKGQTGVVRTLPKNDLIELNTQITAERMLRNGINPNDMKTVGQVENVVKQIDTPKVNVNPGVTGVKKAPVFDMEGNKISEGSGILGGKEVKESDAAIKARIQADNEKGLASMKKNLEDPEEKADGGRIGLLAGSVPKISAAISAVLKNKKKVQQAVDNIFPTGDYKYDAEMAADALVELNPKDFNNLLREDLSDEISSEIYGTVLKPIMSNMAEMRELRKLSKPEKTLQSMKEGKGIDISDPEIADEFTTFMKERDPKGYKELEQKVELSNFKTKGRKENSDGGRIGLKGGGADFEMSDSEKEFEAYKNFLMNEGMKQGDKKLKEQMEQHKKKLMEKRYGIAVADGGRIGLKAGMTKRNFLKLMGSVGAGIGAAKSGIFSGLGKGAGKEVVKEVAKEAAGTYPPPYFFKLAEKIKFMGDDVTKGAATQEREVVTSYKDYMMTEDLGTGNIVIRKRNEGVFYDQDGIVSDEYIIYKPGQADELTKGKKPPAEYDEYTVRPDGDGKLIDSEDGLDSIDEILEEVGDPDSMTIKKASGGIARMLGE